jgi:hypothetical protein
LFLDENAPSPHQNQARAIASSKNRVSRVRREKPAKAQKNNNNHNITACALFSIYNKKNNAFFITCIYSSRL